MHMSVHRWLLQHVLAPGWCGYRAGATTERLPCARALSSVASRDDRASVAGRVVEDRRRLRATRTRANILASCRRLIVNGNLQPEVREIAAETSCGVRTVFMHFGTLRAL